MKKHSRNIMQINGLNQFHGHAQPQQSEHASSLQHGQNGPAGRPDSGALTVDNPLSKVPDDPIQSLIAMLSNLLGGRHPASKAGGPTRFRGAAGFPGRPEGR
jgi:hypothetical protein